MQRQVYNVCWMSTFVRYLVIIHIYDVTRVNQLHRWLSLSIVNSRTVASSSCRAETQSHQRMYFCYKQ